MKKITLHFITLLFLSTSWANASQIDVDVNGLVCEFCAVTIEKNFNKRPEVKEVRVDLEAKKVFIDLKTNQAITDELITEIILNNGYNVVKINR